MGQGDYYRAIGEFKRFLYFCPQDSLAGEAFRSVGLCLFLAQRYDDVIAWQLSDTSRGSQPENDLIVGHSCFRVGAYEQALPVLTRAADNSADQLLASQASYLAGLSAVRLEKFDVAGNLLRDVKSVSPYYNKAVGYAGVLGQARIPHPKSARRAGLLAIVPGLGYAYSGHYQTALASALINGLLIWATVDAFRDEDHAEGAITSVFALGFYLGNISGSMSSAKRYNDYRHREFQAHFVE
jgi:tetratricopeptide (TPR) repeat protein